MTLPTAPAPMRSNAPTAEAAPATTARDLLRHTLATLAYRGGKAVRGAPAHFAIQGPTADALTHVGDITAGRVGAQQAPPRVEFG